jgi:hypothetical protein
MEKVSKTTRKGRKGKGRTDDAFLAENERVHFDLLLSESAPLHGDEEGKRPTAGALLQTATLQTVPRTLTLSNAAFNPLSTPAASNATSTPAPFVRDLTTEGTSSTNGLRRWCAPARRAFSRRWEEGSETMTRL